MRNPKKSRRLAPRDWEEAALAAIGEGGIGAVAVETLAKKLGTTKGSFYWHFADRDALLRAALARWENAETHAVIERLDAMRDPRERMAEVLRGGLADELGGAIDAALLADAQHPLVSVVLKRVAAKRLAFTGKIFRSLGLAPSVASHRALLAYAAYLGHHALARAAPDVMPVGRARRSYLAHVIERLV